VVLVGEPQQARGDAAGLEGVVVGQALGIGHAVVQRTVDHQGGGLHRGGEGMRALGVHPGHVVPVPGAQFLGVPGQASSANIAVQSKQPAWQT
jgi:hypothetical protein